MRESVERERLAALQSLAVLDTPREDRFDRVTRIAQRIFEVPMVAVSFIDQDRQWFKSSIGLDVRETPRRDALCNVTIEESGTLVVPDASTDERFAGSPLVTGDPHIRFYAGHPLRAPGGQHVGALCIIDDTPRQLSEHDTALLADLASWVESELVLREDMGRAQAVQQRLLPYLPPTVTGYDVAGGCLPASEVAGDFFDWFPVAGQLQLTVADVMGKGVGSAIIAASVRAVLRTTSRARVRATPGDPSGLLDLGASVTAAARGLESDLRETSTFVTLFAGRLDPPTGVVRYVDAGHGLSVVVKADGEPVRLPTSGELPLGIEDKGVWTEQRMQLDPGDTFVGVSDGILDVFRSAEEVLDAACTVVLGTSSAQETVDEIIRFARNHRLEDDVTALVIRRDRA